MADPRLYAATLTEGPPLSSLYMCRLGPRESQPLNVEPHAQTWRILYFWPRQCNEPLTHLGVNQQQHSWEENNRKSIEIHIGIHMYTDEYT